jgi:hypothetical protein
MKLTVIRCTAIEMGPEGASCEIVLGEVDNTKRWVPKITLHRHAPALVGTTITVEVKA